MAAPNLLTSPALSTTSNTSSFFMLSSTTPSSSDLSDISDDQVIYGSVSEDSSNEFCWDSDLSFDEEFVVLGRPKSQRSMCETGISTPKDEDDDRPVSSDIVNLSTSLANLKVTQSGPEHLHRKVKSVPTASSTKGVVVARKKQKKKAHASPVDAAAAAYPSPQPSPARVAPAASTSADGKQVSVVPKPKKKKKKKKKKAENVTGLGGRSVVDDVSDKFSDFGENDIGSPSMYEEAFNFISSFLSNPEARSDSVCRLTLLQALIIELGLATSSLPSSLRAAKAYLKSRAFVNIKEYIAVRDQGPAAVQRIMHPSRSALIKDIRKNKTSKASLAWVKDSGLQVLLVQCYH
ncbi:hypothetical protein H0H93_005397 [Arthromyces matolae]|nr:hypothetical protein H0H93_005397 [Arthromyces matolae]